MKVVKTFDEFVNEGGMFFIPGAKGGASTNTPDQETSLKQAYPDAEDSKEQDPYNQSIINKNAVQGPNGTVFVSRDKKTPGGSIDTFSNRTKDENPNNNSMYGQSGVAEKKVEEGGFGDNEVAGQRVYTQTVDKSKQGYQDSMYYGDEDVDSHGEECDCPYCLEKYA